MKKQDKLWWFESHQEIRDYVRQQYPANVFLAKRRATVVRGEEVQHQENVHRNDNFGTPVPDWEIKEGRLSDPSRIGEMVTVGYIEDFAPEEFATKHNYDRYRFEGETVLDAMYQAGDHLAGLLTVSKTGTKAYTAKELTVSALKGGPMLNYPEQEREVLYTVTTPSSRYQATWDNLFEMIDQMEKAENVGPAKRRRFTVKSADGERKVVARLQFDADKMLPKLKKCWANDELRPVMNQPALETKTGVVVASNGHILAAHKLKGYSYDGPDTLMFGDLLLPREITQMKGAVTVEVEEKTFERTIHQEYREDIVQQYEGLLITATDSSGRHGEVRQDARFPNWRSIFPTTVGKPVKVDVKGWTEGVKRVMPQLSSYSQLMRMDAERGAKFIQFYGEDYDFSKGGSVNIGVPVGVKYGLWVGVKAPLLLDSLAFEPEVMYFTDPSRALLFESPETVVICMPMLLNDTPDTPRGPSGDKETMRYSVDKWADPKKAKAKKTVSKKEKVEKKAAAKPRPAVAQQDTQPAVLSIEDRLRAALRKQLAVAA